MKILLIGECYSENLGDGVICDTVAHLIQEKYKGASITYFDLSGRKTYNEYSKPCLDSKKFRWFCRVGYRLPFLVNWHPFYHAYKKDEYRHIRVIANLKQALLSEYDCAIFAGGSLFMDYFAGIIYYVTKELNKKKIPMIFHACGMSSLSKESVVLLNRSFNRKYVSSISLRDSKEEFKKLFPKIKYRDTYDTAFNCSLCFEPCNDIIADIGIGIITIKRHYEFQKDLIQRLLGSDLNWKIFTNGSPGDFNTAINILKELGVNEDKIQDYLLPRPLTPAELIKTITSFKRIISFRMHSQIIASTYYRSSLGFVWDKKVFEMYEKLGLGDFCYIPENPDLIFETMLSKCMDQAVLYQRVTVAAKHSTEDLYNQIEKVL